MSNLKDELTQTISLLEAKLPASLENAENKRLEHQMTANMAEYFRQIELAFPYAELDNLYMKLVKPE